MKKVLFFLSAFIAVPLFILVAILGGLCDHVTEWLYRYEHWCLDREKEGWHYVGNGVWLG